MATSNKTIGIVGVGSMGGNIAQRLHENGYSLILYNKGADAYAPFKGKENIAISDSLSDFSKKLAGTGKNALVWMMIPGGAVTNDTVKELAGILRRGDVVIDASNSEYTDSMSNHRVMSEKGIDYLDVGCAGGPNDLKKGVALYVGGSKAAFKKAEPVFKIVCGSGDYGYVGGPGAGQLVKFFHNEAFYVHFPVDAEAVAGLIATGKANPDMDLNTEEAVRLMSKSPPITTGIMEAIYAAMQNGSIKDAPQMTISTMVKAGIDRAEKQGAKLPLTKAVLERYGSLPEETRKIYSAAKRILTGH